MSDSAQDLERTPPFVEPADEFRAGVSGPQSLGGYRLIRQLGSGGMGVVYEAEDPATGRRVAVKVISEQSAASPEAINRFRQEGRLASAISHPRCVFVLAADEESNVPYIVMELMPGRTLKDLVQQFGPLAPAQAVDKILDVIDGLQEAHDQSVIHRDVKPSNCFLDEYDRVKIGDFGLAKALVADVRLTTTGQFLGTPSFASPEQFKGNRVDLRTDVYSVSATLYFLLTGKPPFDAGNIAEMAARVASEPAPSIRNDHPEIPSDLDAAVLRGLETDRDQRWQDLKQLKTALLPFAPGRMSSGSVAARFGAFCVDRVLFSPLVILVGELSRDSEMSVTANATKHLFIFFIPRVAYFVIFEGIWGRSLGKWLLGLRVCNAASAAKPNLARILLRTVAFCTMTSLPYIVVQEALGAPDNWTVIGLLMLTWLASEASTMITMRARNGFRGIHELISGTRVVQVTAVPSWRLPTTPLDWATGTLAHPGKIPLTVATYSILGALRWDEKEKLLLAEDPVLGRNVLIHLQPRAQDRLCHNRQTLARPTRLRWLANGLVDDMHWDSFVTPSGCLLTDVVWSNGRLSWPQTRRILEQLADELAAACVDGTLPPTLDLEQVSVIPSGCVQLLDVPMGQPFPMAQSRKESTDLDGNEQIRALRFIRRVAVQCLEGHSFDRHEHVRAPIPIHASRLLNRFLANDDRYETVEDFQAELESTGQRPTTTTVGLRSAHVAIQGVFLFLGLVAMWLGGNHNVYALTMLSTLHSDTQKTLHAIDRDALGNILIPTKELELAARWLVQPADLRTQWLKMRRESIGALDERLRAECEARLASMRWYHGWIPGDFSTSDDSESGETLSGETVLAVLSLSDTPHRQMMSVVVRYSSRLAVLVACLPPLLWILWAGLLRDGISARIIGLHLVRADGRRASHLTCVRRASLVWGPVIVLLALPPLLQTLAPTAIVRPMFWLVAALLIGYVFMALRSPERSLHDRLSGTYLVPR